MGRIRLLCALALSCAVGALRAAEPAPPVDPQVARIVAALQARLAAAADLCVVYGAVSYVTQRRPVANGEPEEVPCQVGSASTCYCLDHGDKHHYTWYAALRDGPAREDRWVDQFEFASQDGVRREQIIMCFGPIWSQNGPQLTISAPRNDVRGHLYSVGLGVNDGSLLTSQLKGKLRVEGGRSIRGYQCEALVGDNGELWVSKELQYAPLRMILRGEEQGQSRMSVKDWLQYAQAGGLSLPRLELSRGATQQAGEWQTTGQTICRIKVAAAGEAAIEALDLPQLHVPLLVGMAVVDQDFKQGNEVPEFGYWPHSLVRIGENDCAEWGLSAKALWADTDFKLPDTD